MATRTPSTLLALLLTWGTTGCASGSAGAGAPPLEVVRGVEGTERIVQTGQVETGRFPAPPAAVFSAVEAVLEELELSVTTRSPAEGLLASEGQRLVRLAGRRASNWVDCGSTITGRVADEAQVLLSVTAVVAPAEGGTDMALRVDAEALNRGTVEGVRECTSTGRLESLLTERVRTRLSGNR